MQEPRLPTTTPPPLNFKRDLLFTLLLDFSLRQVQRVRFKSKAAAAMAVISDGCRVIASLVCVEEEEVEDEDVSPRSRKGTTNLP